MSAPSDLAASGAPATCDIELLETTGCESDTCAKGVSYDEGPPRKQARVTQRRPSRPSVKEVKTDMLSPGPACFEEVYNFGDQAVQGIADALAGSGTTVGSMLESVDTVVMTTVFSGIGTPELSMPFVSRGFANLGESG